MLNGMKILFKIAQIDPQYGILDPNHILANKTAPAKESSDSPEGYYHTSHRKIADPLSTSTKKTSSEKFASTPPTSTVKSDDQLTKFSAANEPPLSLQKIANSLSTSTKKTSSEKFASTPLTPTVQPLSASNSGIKSKDGPLAKFSAALVHFKNRLAQLIDLVKSKLTIIFYSSKSTQHQNSSLTSVKQNCLPQTSQIEEDDQTISSKTDQKIPVTQNSLPRNEKVTVKDIVADVKNGEVTVKTEFDHISPKEVLDFLWDDQYKSHFSDISNVSSTAHPTDPNRKIVSMKLQKIVPVTNDEERIEMSDSEMIFKWNAHQETFLIKENTGQYKLTQTDEGSTKIEFQSKMRVNASINWLIAASFLKYKTASTIKELAAGLNARRRSSLET